jgi:transcriptional regulator GlxA family with amidase domain
VLDFAGPFEVFGVATTADGEAAFDVVTVALHPGEVIARNDLRIIPSGTAENLGDFDILIVPGGFGTRRELQNPAMLDFLRATSRRAELTMSVCTGSLLLSGAGLLKGLAATTHWAAMDELRALNSGAEILPDARIVDNGAVITAAGISAGIDAALYVVSRLLGEDRAQSTARYMQYDWRFGIDGETVVK